jgi:hypothetical protein
MTNMLAVRLNLTLLLLLLQMPPPPYKSEAGLLLGG